MSRTERSLIIPAVIGLIVMCVMLGMALGGDWTNRRYAETGRPAAARQAYEKSLGNSSFSAYPIVDSNRCYGSPDHDVADLCAQWRAALAAERAARASEWSLTMTVAGAILSALGLLVLLATLSQGRDALARARESNELTRQTALHQLRAYISVTAGGVTDFDKESGPKGSISLKNVGQTPAFNLSSVIKTAYLTGSTTLYHPDVEKSGSFTVHPGQQITYQGLMENPFIAKMASALS